MKVNSKNQNNIAFGAFYSKGFVLRAKQYAKGANVKYLEKKLIEISGWGDSRTELIPIVNKGGFDSARNRVSMVAKNTKLPKTHWSQSPIKIPLASNEVNELDVIINTTPELVNKLERTLMNDTVRDYQHISEFKTEDIKKGIISNGLMKVYNGGGKDFTVKKLLADLKSKMSPSVYENFANYKNVE